MSQIVTLLVRDAAPGVSGTACSRGLHRNMTAPVRLFACKVVSHFAVISNPSVMFRYSPQSVPDTGTAAAVAFL